MNTLTKLIDFYNKRSEKDYHDLTEQILRHYRKIPEMIAKNLPTGSYAAGCPAEYVPCHYQPLYP